MLCGDSNQIVHPNFFSWSQVKSLFWRDPSWRSGRDCGCSRPTSATAGNHAPRQYAAQDQAAALRLHRPREQFPGRGRRRGNGQGNAAGGHGCRQARTGSKIRQSTQFAVLVMRDEDKPAARKYFSTPLLFSIHEAKGLEYENIVLFRFVSGYRREFAEIAAGVARRTSRPTRWNIAAPATRATSRSRFTSSSSTRSTSR